MPKTTYFSNAMINSGLRNTPYVSVSTIYVALFTVIPGVGGGGTEVGIGAYGRQTVTFTAPASGASSNTADVTFPVATLDWGSIVAFALFDASSGGNMLYFASLSSPRTVLANDQFRFPTGQLVCQEA